MNTPISYNLRHEDKFVCDEELESNIKSSNKFNPIKYKYLVYIRIWAEIKFYIIPSIMYY